jgi:uncharacterized membrane protein YesL
MYTLSLLAAFPVGGAVAACFFCITKMFRDQPSYVWYDFKRKFLENMKQAAAPGMLCVAFIYTQILMWRTIFFSGVSIDAVWIAIGVIVLLIFEMVVPYMFLQIAYIKLRTRQVMKNSVLIAFINTPRSFLGAITGGVIWIAYALLLPTSLYATPLILIIGFTFSWWLCLFWIWPPVNKLFKIEEVLKERQNCENVTDDRQ